jgi:hypothetical protein
LIIIIQYNQFYKMTFGFIYKIQFPNGKHYIGLTTTSLELRKSQHKCEAKKGNTKYLYNALRKYDMIDTFELIEIDTSDTMDELTKKEIEYIIKYNSYYKNENGYNMTYGGEGNNGYNHTEEDKQIMSKIKKKYFENTEIRKKLSKSHIKRFENEEERKKVSERMKKYFENPDAIKKNKEALQKYHKEHPEHSERMKKLFEENPKLKDEFKQRMKKYSENPELKRTLSDGKGKNKPFDIFTKEGHYIKTFNYQFEAEDFLQKEYNITRSINISVVLSGKIKSSAGFVFKYK